MHVASLPTRARFPDLRAFEWLERGSTAVHCQMWDTCVSVTRSRQSASHAVLLLDQISNSSRVLQRLCSPWVWVLNLDDLENLRSPRFHSRFSVHNRKVRGGCF